MEEGYTNLNEYKGELEGLVSYAKQVRDNLVDTKPLEQELQQVKDQIEMYEGNLN